MQKQKNLVSDDQFSGWFADTIRYIEYAKIPTPTQPSKQIRLDAGRRCKHNGPTITMELAWSGSFRFNKIIQALKLASSKFFSKRLLLLNFGKKEAIYFQNSKYYSKRNREISMIHQSRHRMARSACDWLYKFHVTLVFTTMVWPSVIGWFQSCDISYDRRYQRYDFFQCGISLFIVVNIETVFLFTLVAMHCLTCGKKSSSNGDSILQMYKKITPTFLNVFVRGVVLFIVGGFLALFLTVLSSLPESRRRNLGDLPYEVILNVFSDTWWIPPSCGTAAVVIGLIYPMSDSRLGEPHKFQRDWSSVARCVAIFVGINHACAVSLCSNIITEFFCSFIREIFIVIIEEVTRTFLFKIYLSRL